MQLHRYTMYYTLLLHRKFKGLSFAAILLCISIQASSQEKKLLNLIDQIEQIQSKYNIPAVGLSIIANDSVLYQGATGIADGRGSANENSYFRLGSISKTFISLGILDLQQQGKLNIEMPVSQLAPELNIDNPWKETNPVTLRQLLEHTAGLYDMSFHEIFRVDLSNPLSAQKALDLTTSAHKVIWKPGTYFSYSNPGYLIAGYILEKYAGMPFEEFLEKRILPKFNMERTRFTEATLTENQRPIGHIWNGNSWLLSENRELINRWAGSMVSTPKDMTNFMLALVADSSVIQPSLVEMATPASTLASRHGIQIGYGLGMESLTLNGQNFYGNRGGGYNLSSRFRLIPETKSGFFLAFNSASGPFTREIEQLLLNFISVGNEKEFLESSSISDELANQLEGNYQLRSHRQRFLKPFERLTMGVDLMVRNDTIFRTTLNGSLPPLLLQEGNRFFSPGAAEPHVIIDEIDGNWTLIDTNLNGQYFEKSTKLWSQLRLIGVALSVIIIALSLPILLFKILRCRFYSDQKLGQASLLFLLAGVCPFMLIGTVTTLGIQDFDKLGHINLRTILFLVITLIYPATVLLGSIKMLRAFKTSTKLNQIGNGVLMISHWVLVLFLLLNGYIGMQLWSL